MKSRSIKAGLGLWVLIAFSLTQGHAQNATDSSGQKTGKWVDYFSWGGIQAEGAYSKGKKVGRWTYYRNADRDVSAVERTVAYNPDGSTKELKTYSSDADTAYAIRISADSSIVSGKAFYQFCSWPRLKFYRKGQLLYCNRYLKDGAKIETTSFTSVNALVRFVRVGQW